MSGDVVIAGIGMMTSVGLSVPENAASVRAGLMRFVETEWLDHNYEPFKIAEVPEDGLPDLAEELERQPGLTSREIRLLRLAAAPLAESVRPIASLKERPGLVLALPELETARPLDHPSLLKRLAVQTGGAFAPDMSASGFRGRAGGLMAVGRAVEIIRSGQARFMVAGGVDTYRDLYILGSLDKDKRVKSSEHLDGFIPGEGAAFLLLTAVETARSLNLAASAAVTAAARGVEPGHLYSNQPYRGDGLAEAVSQFFGQGGPAPVREVYSSMNGESHWAKEWGVASLRNRTDLDGAHGMHHPADCFGDTGAACGPLMAGLAAHGIRQGYRHAPCMVCCSSDYGDRAVAGLRSVEN
jgi:3-oxoacyl-[acyl-carrier-protein] synthase-1